MTSTSVTFRAMSVRPRLQKPPIQVEVIEIDESEEEEDLLPEGNEILEDGDESESDDDNLSIYEDALTAMDNQGHGDGMLSRLSWFNALTDLAANSFQDACTPEEGLVYRKRLRKIGKVYFLEETVLAKAITAKKLCTAFGIRLPEFLDGAPDESYYPLLGICINRELRKREKIPHYNSVDDAVSLLKKSKNIIVLTGAGVFHLAYTVFVRGHTLTGSPDID